MVDWIDSNTNVTHMIHKRVWPAAQRDSCILSHLRQQDKNTWLVQNVSVSHEKAPEREGYVRLSASILLMCRTQIREGAREPYSRADVGCHITYMAYVHPGGWAPPSVVA